MSQPRLVTAYDVLPSPARVDPSLLAPVRVGLVQERWHADPGEHRDAIARGVRIAAGEGARLVCLQELTLSAYFAITPDGPTRAGVEAEALPGGPTHTFVSELAAETGAYVHASLYERAPGGHGHGHGHGLGFNTAFVVAPDGTLVARTRKLHLPVTAGYYEDQYFQPGDTGFPVVDLADARFGFPTCWDQWFPEVARSYALLGADVIVYPTAIGSEPDHPGFDTQPIWEQVIRANGIANGTFMVVPNRTGTEGPVTFYGSSFISDPYGRVIAQAPRDQAAVLVADLDLDQRRDWLALFPLLSTRRPDTYGVIVEPNRETEMDR
jgi:N-carbamoylputrescine amidase